MIKRILYVIIFLVVPLEGYAYLTECDTKECVRKYVEERTGLKCESFDSIFIHAVSGNALAQYYAGKISFLKGLTDFQKFGDENIEHLLTAFNYFSKCTKLINTKRPFGMSSHRMMKMLDEINKIECNSVNCIYKLAENGNSTAQYIIGELYIIAGHGNPEVRVVNHKMVITGYEWLKKAADGGNAEAQYLMGTIYDQQIVPFDRDKCEKYIDKASKQEHPDALWIKAVAISHLTEMKVNKNSKYCECKKSMLLKSAEGGNLRAMSEIGRMYSVGECFDLDNAKAEQMYMDVALKAPMMGIARLVNLYAFLHIEGNRTDSLYVWSSVACYVSNEILMCAELQERSIKDLSTEELLRAKEQIEVIKDTLELDSVKQLFNNKEEYK